MDQVANFIKETVNGTHTSSDTTVNVDDASNFPDPSSGEYNLTWWDSTNYPDPSDDPNVEIVRVTAYDTSANTLTVTRAQESTTASDKNTSGATYKMILAPTKKTIDDIDDKFPDGDVVGTTDTQTLTNKTLTSPVLNGTLSGTGITALLQAIYPVGSIFVSASSTMPTLISGIGTWTRIQGKMIVGASDTDTDFDNGDEGGEKAHILTKAELPNYNLEVGAGVSSPGVTTQIYYRSSGTHGHGSHPGHVSEAPIDGSAGSYKMFAKSGGSGSAHNNLPPYKARYMWERTA